MMHCFPFQCRWLREGQDTEIVQSATQVGMRGFGALSRKNCVDVIGKRICTIWDNSDNCGVKPSWEAELCNFGRRPCRVSEKCWANLCNLQGEHWAGHLAGICTVSLGKTEWTTGGTNKKICVVFQRRTRSGCRSCWSTWQILGDSLG